MGFSANRALLANYFRTAVRNLAKNKFFTILNVFGLALGMSISLLFIAGLTFLQSFDSFHTNGDRIYRVTTHRADNSEHPHYASAPAGLVQRFRSDFTGVEKVVAIYGSLSGEIIYRNNKISLNGYFTEPEFLDLLTFPLVKGDNSSALVRPNTIILTEKAAAKIFGEQNPLGEVVQMEPYGEFVVTGILKDLPKNSHMNFEALASYSTLLTFEGSSFTESAESWREFFNNYVYLRLPEKPETANVQHFLDRIADEIYVKGKDIPVRFELQALDKIVPGPEMSDNIGASFDYLGIVIVGIMTMLILLPACANYVNLSIAQSLKRMKEIGVRKVMGGQKKQIVFQFIMETTVMMLLALTASYLIFELMRREFQSQMGLFELTPTFLTVIYFIVFALGLGFATGLIPALYLSKTGPVIALKGKPEAMDRGSTISFKKVVTTGQFVLSLGFTMIVVIMLQQYRFSVNYDFGFKRENIVDVELQDISQDRFRTEFAKLSSVQRISMSSHVPGLGAMSSRYVLEANQTDSVEASAISADENFIPNIELTFLAGGNFSDRASENLHSIIVNEEFVKDLNFSDPAAAVDNMVLFADGKEAVIRGVVKNFHYGALRHPIGSFFFEYDPAKFRYANVKVAAGASVDMPAMERIWKNIGGIDKFKAQLLTDEIKDAYIFYFEMVKLYGFLGLLAITVTCLGLLGTVVFTLRNRLKEISIRKVMGASVESLVILLSREFIYLMLIASVIAIPAVYFLFDYLLLSIQYYSIQIGVVEISISLVIISLLGFSTILSQTRKAANANPVDYLRTE
jgi:putative ABC transport system permease protein